jgi:hypothetical protein
VKRGLLALLCLLSVASHAATFTVINLNDSGAGSLRDAVAQSNATPGANTIDFAAGLTGTIVLTSGELLVKQGPLTITGPGVSVLAIDGNANDRILSVEDDGALACPAQTDPNDYLFTMSGLTLKNGNRTASHSGGALVSRKSLVLQNMVIEGSRARLGGGVAFLTQYNAQLLTLQNVHVRNNIARPLSAIGTTGGGVYIAPLCGGVFLPASVTIANVIIEGNQVTPVDSQQGYAGGLYLLMRGTATVTDSRIIGNRVILPTTLGAFSYGGGGIGADVSSLTIASSEIAENQANLGGGMEFFNVDATQQGAANRRQLLVTDTTVSGNTAYNTSGGMQIVGNVHLRMVSSTVSANTAQPDRTGGFRVVNNPGLTEPTAMLESSIIADNATTTTDIGVSANVVLPVVIPSTNILVRRVINPSAFTFSGTGNLIYASPGLAPLAFNGGSTRTHALLPTSVAIDTGANPANLINDQRGAGYPRVLGAAADIGAYEYPASCAGFVDAASIGAVLCANLDWMRNRVITQGCAAGAYCPADNVRRDQMAAFMNRVGKALTPETMYVQLNSGPITLPGEAPAPAFRTCVTADSSSVGYPRQAVVRASVAGRADGNIASWRTPLVISYDGGLNWDNFSPLTSVGPRVSAEPGSWAHSTAIESVALPPGAVVRFGINIRRDNQTSSTGNLTDSRCQLEVEIHNRTVSAPPY